jgi:hypothetical protein
VKGRTRRHGPGNTTELQTDSGAPFFIAVVLAEGPFPNIFIKYTAAAPLPTVTIFSSQDFEAQHCP